MDIRSFQLENGQSEILSNEEVINFYSVVLSKRMALQCPFHGENRIWRIVFVVACIINNCIVTEIKIKIEKLDSW